MNPHPPSATSSCQQRALVLFLALNSLLLADLYSIILVQPSSGVPLGSTTVLDETRLIDSNFNDVAN